MPLVRAWAVLFDDWVFADTFAMNGFQLHARFILTPHFLELNLHNFDTMKALFSILFTSCLFTSCGDDCKSCSATETVSSQGIVISQVNIDNTLVCDEQLAQIEQNPVVEVSVIYLGTEATQRTIWTCQ